MPPVPRLRSPAVLAGCSRGSFFRSFDPGFLSLAGRFDRHFLFGFPVHVILFASPTAAVDPVRLYSNTDAIGRLLHRTGGLARRPRVCPLIAPTWRLRAASLHRPAGRPDPTASCHAAALPIPPPRPFVSRVKALTGVGGDSVFRVVPFLKAPPWELCGWWTPIYWHWRRFGSGGGAMWHLPRR